MRSVGSLSLVYLLVGGANVYSSELFFGAISENVIKNEYCSLHVTEPQLLAKEPANPELRQFVTTSNARWQRHLKEVKDEFLTIISRRGACLAYEDSYNRIISFEIQTELNSPIVSLLYSDYQYTGGAHGGTKLAAQTFNAETGKRYRSLADFFSEDKLQVIKHKILTSLQSEHDSFDPSFGWERWDRETEQLSKIQNFHLTKTGISIFFQEYEVGSYAEGPMTANLSWDEIKEIGVHDDDLSRLIDSRYSGY
jgi:hypothetical protein